MRKDKKTWRYGKPHKGQSSEKVPHYCKRSKEWRCMVDYPWAESNYEERGTLEYVMAEFSQYCEIYHFKYEDAPHMEVWQDHEHEFAGVLLSLINCPKHFSVEDFEDEYSKQQLDLMKVVKEKLLDMVK